MASAPQGDRGPSSDSSATNTEALSGQVNDNIRAIMAFHEREQQKLGDSQRLIERLGALMARPHYLATILTLVIAWIGCNELLLWTGRAPYDAPPFELLQGLVTLTALVTTGIVLSAQARAVRLEKQRAHLDLQVNLVTEQKVTKIIDLIEELRRDLPMVKDRHDPVAAELQRQTDPHLVLTAIEESGATGDASGGGRGQS